LIGERSVYMDDSRVRLIGSHERHVIGACSVIGQEATLSAEHAVVFATPHRGTDIRRS